MNLWNDLRYSARSLRKSPGFTATAVLTLAFGIGVTTATFSTADALLWKPLPLHHLDRLAMIVQRVPGDPADFRADSLADLADIRSRASSFDGIAWWGEGLANIVGAGGEPERVVQFLVSSNFFDVLGEPPALGRTFLAGEDQPGRDRVVILSDRLWRRRFGANPAIVGTNIRLDDENFVVAGVMGPGIEFPQTAELWTPLALTQADRAARDRSQVTAAGRLKPGSTVAQAGADLDRISRQLASEFPATNRERNYMTMSAHDFMVGYYTHNYTLLLVAAVVFVLLIACGNVANLQLARALGREREVALRTALGAGRAQVIAQLMTESTLLALIGGALGLIVASWSLDAIRGGMPPEIEKYVVGWQQIRLDGRALAATLAASLLTGILAGLAPALRCSRANLHDVLKEGARGASAGRERHRLRSLLVAAEMALAVVLLVGASLMVRSFQTMAGGSASLEPASLLTLRLAITENKYREGFRQAEFYSSVLERIRAIPGVKSVAAATALPYAQHSSGTNVRIEGRPDDPGAPLGAMLQNVSSGYFATLRVPLWQGRFLSASDGPDSPRVAVISERAVRQWFPGGASPVGRKISVAAGPAPVWMTVVGVVGDTAFSVYDRAPRRVVYVPFQQVPRVWMDLAVRTAGDPLQVVPAVTAAIRSVDAEQPVTGVASMQTLMQHDATGIIYVASMMGIFGLLALALSAIGVYGVMAYVVSEQTHEIGIRMALGAQRGAVLRMVFRRGILTTGIGLAVGVGLAWPMARTMSTLIFGVTATDPVTFLSIPLALLSAAALAIYIPARRAVRIDPIAALRVE